MKIGLLSDTHGYLDPKVEEFFAACDEVWHCGDVGSGQVLNRLASRFRLRAVYGNIDDGELRMRLSGITLFTCEGVKVLMTHIGGYPNHYEPHIREIILRESPRLFVCGHSHILKVMYDKELQCLHINPGAIGRFGFHKKRTAVRFVIEGENIKDLEILELEA
ncbi:MAG: metallophosphatase family protein [Odoribacter sp.]|nr:metallophosphatase family protein [Odoribacter sp.]